MNNGEGMAEIVNLADISDLADKNNYAQILKQRFRNGKMCTRAGHILLAVNPQKMQVSEALSPQVIDVAAHAFHLMREKSGNQSILMSGESGAGKTHTAEVIMAHLLEISNAGGEGNLVHQRIINASPILESFGNARTVLNDNSSRFGKYIEMKFSPKGGFTEACVESYLLEKVRVISLTNEERNYHVFYELLSMVHNKEDVFHLRGYDWSDFNLLNKGVGCRRDGVKDQDKFQKMRDSMNTVGFSSNEVVSMLKIVSGLLHASNLEISQIEGSNECAIVRNERRHLEIVGSLMGIETDILERGICCETITPGGTTTIAVHQNPEKCKKRLDAFIKASYAELFDYLVRKINQSTGEGADRSRGGGGGGTSCVTSIGILVSWV